MTETQNLDAVKNLFSFSAIEDLSVTLAEDNLFRITKRSNEPSPSMQLPVNNYLKTPEEIEAEFHYMINSRKAVSGERKESQDNDGRSTSETEGYMSIHNLEVTLSGFMEENY